MKRIFTLVMAIILITTLCSCKKINEDVSDNSSFSKLTYSSEISDITSDTLSETQESEVSETKPYDDASNAVSNVTLDNIGSDNQSAVSEDNLNETDSSNEKGNNSGVNYENENIPVKQDVYLTVDTSRAPSTDVGSIISNGYIYYTNPTTEFEDGLFRKKITGGTEETITDQSVTHYRVLDEKVYYVSQGNLYSCNTNGSEIKKIYDGVSSFEVAGKWIFAARIRNTTAIGKPVQELYAISTDGSKEKRIQPDQSNEAGSTVTIHGFNRGYCYVTVTHTRYIAGEPNTISMTSNSVRLRIDYRSEDLTQENLKNNTEYTYEGFKRYGFDFMGNMIRYDYVFQRSGGKNWIVSLTNNTANTLFESQMALPQCRLKDYFVYIPEESTTKNCNIVFVDFNGTKKTFNYDWTDYGHNIYQIYHEQDIHGNSLLMQTRTRDANGSDVYTLYIVDSDGAVTEIYSKTP